MKRLLLAVLLIAGCTEPDDPNLMAWCDNEGDCTGEARCEPVPGSQRGVCTVGCEAQADCYEHSVCGYTGPALGAVCLWLCDSDADCPDDTGCLQLQEGAPFVCWPEHAD